MRNRICKVTQHHVYLKRGENVSKMPLIHVAAKYFRLRIQRFSHQDRQVAIKSDDVGFRMLVLKKKQTHIYLHLEFQPVMKRKSGSIKGYQALGLITAYLTSCG